MPRDLNQASQWWLIFWHAWLVHRRMIALTYPMIACCFQLPYQILPFHFITSNRCASLFYLKNYVMSSFKKFSENRHTKRWAALLSTAFERACRPRRFSPNRQARSFHLSKCVRRNVPPAPPPVAKVYHNIIMLTFSYYKSRLSPALG